MWIGADPGGEGKFGLAILEGSGSCHTWVVDHADEAMSVIRERVHSVPAGVGVDAPLWWSSGPGGLRRADQWIRETHGLASRNVQAVNSMWGAVLAQGMMFVMRIRELFPGVPVTEVHPKAVLAAGTEPWTGYFGALSTDVTLDSQPDDRRDAIVAAVAAREGFEGRWRRDLAEMRYASEQDPSRHWLGPIHYFWPA